ncbi:hypothetical protein DMA15_17465 [Streptomyces sp. WAC 01529]|uniref:hypothetical protein n=1 Tax=Streptomyces sp. WAC 01529 TaxID=2203205 RepID=UPI000F710113|nr:hypothetical protein [Streptomyces sp. WAC 01529]AZM54137.1 hypothetical protein DMA15_17465 [Streptomyces sp. WAC 01529]
MTHDPLVLITRDGVVWMRRAITRDGLGLYAVTDSVSCPEYVMATQAELAARGIARSVAALPMPVGDAPTELGCDIAELRAALQDTLAALRTGQSERETLQARVTELEGQHTSARTADEDPIAYALTPQAIDTADRLTDPLIVDRFDVAMEPAPEDPPVLIVGATASDGMPVALFFDVEDRAKVASWLAPKSDSSRERRLKQLPDEEANE